MPQETIGKTENLELTAPEKLDDTHDISAFDCREKSINEYLWNMARKAQDAKHAVVYVTCLKGTKVVKGFYTLTSGSVMRSEVPKILQRNSPKEHPVTILGRLGVDCTVQGRGVAKALLQDAIERSIGAAETVASSAILVQALDDKLAQFYRKHAGFIPSPMLPLTLMLPLK